MDTYGIIGYPLGHSRSPHYFNTRFRELGIGAEYLYMEMEELWSREELFKRYPRLKGFNVTVPHKQHILPYLDDISEEAAAVGAVNCVKVSHSGGQPRLTGFNTDVSGFRKALLEFIPSGISKALVLGNGGAAKAVRHVLHALRMEVLTVSRTPRHPDEIGYAQVANHLPTTLLIVNTTPLGSWPEVTDRPDIPYGQLTPGHYLFDLVYNPEVTAFMQQGEKQGAHVCNGYAMWLEQAQKSWEIWMEK